MWNQLKNTMCVGYIPVHIYWFICQYLTSRVIRRQTLCSSTGHSVRNVSIHLYDRFSGILARRDPCSRAVSSHETLDSDGFWRRIPLMTIANGLIPRLDCLFIYLDRLHNIIYQSWSFGSFVRNYTPAQRNPFLFWRGLHMTYEINFMNLLKWRGKYR